MILELQPRKVGNSVGLSGIVKNHPFIDGNKRTGFVVAIAFLQINGWRLEASG